MILGVNPKLNIQWGQHLGCIWDVSGWLLLYAWLAAQAHASNIEKRKHVLFEQHIKIESAVQLCGLRRATLNCDTIARYFEKSRQLYSVGTSNVGILIIACSYISEKFQLYDSEALSKVRVTI